MRTHWQGIWSFSKVFLSISGFISVFSTMVYGETWDVENTGQPYKEAEITVTEGSWMSLDVSPDGKTIVFDLLGDLYLLPIEGGTATPITQGAAIDRTPSFSPDGSKILYISDRSGADNAWTISLDGTNARQVTYESTRMVANPAWGADGSYIVAATIGIEFTEQKQSEIRLYHLEGGAGRTIVGVPDNGRDVQEPEFAPDGSYLYYTKRLVDHHIYVDANHINYGIMRRDMASGYTDEMVAGFGGALAPQASPDGRYVAFVRRVKAKTLLFLYDTEKREQFPIYDELDRDQQADFYPQGVYFPKYGWMPDSKELVIWGKGKIYRIAVADGSATEIPFEATGKHKIVIPPKFADPMAPDEVTVKTARDMAVSPDGKTAVFHASGYLWKKQLPDGVPARLTKGTDFEFEPSWSPNGKNLVYVSWNDETGSQVQYANKKGKLLKTLIASKGAARNPVFSPDSKTVAFTIDAASKGFGGYKVKAGLYTVPVKGGEAVQLTDSGDNPQFSSDGNRIYYLNKARDTKLLSVNLSGFDAHEHAIARTPDRNTIAFSPDGKWIAFKENHQVYVMPYVETGALTEIRAEGAAVPVTGLTKMSGFDLNWSSDSRTLYWSLGEALFKVNMETLPTSGHVEVPSYAKVGLKLPGDKPKGVVAFTGGRVITMKGEEIIDNGTVVVDGNRIVAVGPAGNVAIPDDAFVVDTAGKTVMPGIVDMHGHIVCCYYGGLMPQKHSGDYAAVAYGVTTNFDPYPAELQAYSTTEMQQAGVIVGPRAVTTGRVIYGRAGKGDTAYAPIHSYEDALNIMNRKRALGGRVIKSYKQPMREARQQLVKAGREKGLMIDAEGESHVYYNIGMLLDGHMNLEHLIPVRNYYDDIIQLFAASGVSTTPTLNVTFGEIMGENHIYQTTRAWEDPKVNLYVQYTTSSYSGTGTPYSAPVYVRNMTTLHAVDEIYDLGFRSAARSMKRLDDAGVIVNTGSHGQAYGLAVHWEMWSMAEGGMSNHRVLRTATLNGAKTLGVADQIGSLEVGKLADVIVLDKNPLENIRNTKSVKYTMVNGRLYDSLSMNEIGNYNKPRTKFYWELPDYNGIEWNETWAGQ